MIIWADRQPPSKRAQMQPLINDIVRNHPVVRPREQATVQRRYRDRRLLRHISGFSAASFRV
ncbi:hypothetical protein PMIN01_03466 [Paraphaeosphaeria minitans]|uniref:Uncharacterized protein n=1 Tax=Paraphaeosphaeria minitans TaxID=565426 RepID=A0A9P6GML4_9PLEO|nr:hypothetical protein PMIN01_03466 [Paraphaeosphaeria minitans]